MIKTYAYDKTLIILLFCCYLFPLTLIFASFIFPFESGFFIAFVISGCVLLLLIFLIQIYVLRKRVVVYFNKNGIFYKLNNNVITLTWDKIISIHHYDWIFFVDPNMVDIVYEENNERKILNDILGGTIHLTKTKFRKVIKLIPIEYSIDYGLF